MWPSSSPPVFQPDRPNQNRIDELVFANLARLGIPPAALSSDAVFLRRAFLDLTGTLPTAQEARQFLGETNPNKRAELIDNLLDRQEFADYWANKWSDSCDQGRVPDQPLANAAQAYHHWIWLRFVKTADLRREMLTGAAFSDSTRQLRAMRSRSRESPEPSPSPLWASKIPPTALPECLSFFPVSGSKKPTSGRRRSSSSTTETRRPEARL
jgi:hypothetical protein